MYISSSFRPDTPPDSGIRGDNVHISFKKAEHAVPTPFLVRVSCSVTIVAAQLLQLGAVSDNFQFYLSLFSGKLFLLQLLLFYFLLFFLKNGRFSFSQKCDVTIQIFENCNFQNILTFPISLIVRITSLIC